DAGGYRVKEPHLYTVVEFDFRRLSSEAFKPEEDLAVEFLRKIEADSSDIANQAIDKYKEASAGRSVAEQRQLFRDALRMNRNRGKQTVLFLDECQEIGGFFGEDRYKTFFVFLDSLCREPELGLCVMLACRPSFFELEPIRTINFGRFFESINLGPLEESAAISVIHRGEPDIQF